MNHRSATLKLRGATLAACAGLITVIACGGGDDSTIVGSDDAGGSDVTTGTGSSSSGGGSSSSSGGGPDAASDAASTTPEGGSSDATADRSVEASLADTSTSDVHTSEAGPADAGEGGSAADADGGPAPLVPLTICPVLDTDYAITTDGVPDDDYSLRVTTWSEDITGPSGFAEALTNDCRVNGIIATFAASGPRAQAAYLDQLAGWAPLFFGCGPLDAGAVTFAGLLPASAAGHTFTVADLNVFARLFEDSTNARASLNWAANYPTANAEPLTFDQIDAIQSQLNALEAAYPGLNQNTTHLTFSTCGEDAGPEGGADAGEEAGSEAGSTTGDAGADAAND